jgi:hypothetical protein
MSAPDAAAGKRVKCPKCQTLIDVPSADLGYEVVDAPPAAAVTPARVGPARPGRPAPADDEDDRPARRPRDDDEDDEDDRPRRKPAKRKGKKMDFLSSPPVLIVGGLIGCAVAAGFLYKVSQYVEREKEREEAALRGPVLPGPAGQPKAPPVPATPPPGWQTFAPPGTGLTVAVPIALQPQIVPKQPSGGKAEIWQAVHNEKVYQVNVITPEPRLNGPPSPGYYDDIFQQMGQRFGGGGQVRDPGPITVSGHPAVRAKPRAES